MKTKTLTKIMSSVLCAALTMQIGWGATKKQVNAAGTMQLSLENEMAIVEINTSDSGTSHFNFTASSSDEYTYSIKNLTPASNTSHVMSLGRIDIIKIGGWAIADIYTDIETAIEFTNSNAMLYVQEGTLTATSFSGTGYMFAVYDNGALECETFKGSDFSNFNGGVIIYGKIIANSIDLTSTTNISSIDKTEYHVSSSFTNGTNTLYGTVIAEPTTTISSAGGSFNLQVGGIKKEITGTFTNKSAASLVYDDPGLSLNIPTTTIYYGTEYNFESYISVADGYDASKVYLEYKSSNDLLDEKPTAVGSNYSVRAVAPAYGTYKSADSGWKNFAIKYLPVDQLGVSAPYFTVNGIVNDKYVTGDLLLDTVSGIQAGSTYSGSDFTESLTIDSSLMFRDGSLNSDYGIALRNSDKATTDEYSFSYWYPAASELIYDPYDPYVGVQFVDGREMSIEDGKLTGDTVTIGIGDENLDKIYINGELYDYKESEEGFVELELNSTVGKATDYSIKATDLAGRSSTLEFTLFPNTADAIVTVTVPEGTIYSGDDYKVTTSTNSDGEVTLQYKDASTNTVLTSKPTEAGKYTVTATSAETEFYFEAEASANYTIIKRTPDTTITVPNVVYVGDDYDVEVDTDSNGDIAYQYFNKNNNSYLAGKPTSAGEYTVTVKTAETSKYYSSEETATFKIIKKDPSVTLSVPDTIVGQTYAPVLETDSDSKLITYEYKVKGAADSTFTKTKPTAAGSYTIRVTIGSTAKYNEASATENFTISKKTPSVSLGVGTPYAGTTYTPSFSSNSDGASKAVFEYKEKNADDSKYTTTLPTAYGEYVVRVTIPETAEFAKTTATADYRIIYLAAPQTAYIVEGKSGKNNYFVSDVVLKAPTGYTISAVYGGNYTASIPYKDGITSVYLKRTSDNALTSGIPITNAPKIDTNAPSISATTGSVAQGSVMYVSDFTLNVSDPNLKSLKVNGEAVDLSNYKNGYTLTLSPGFGSQTYKIMAEDEAGNVTTLEFTLKAEWLQNKIIIPDVVLPLEGNESYNLDKGHWLVTRKTPQGPVTDKTVYSGNMPFYVTEGGDYTFTKVT